ncbi:glycerophosphodiester phosphodiesterase [Bremerella sp. T1]|uniref:glycerophosphodiester phosphodiesterase n=1 Tax=Bremerella sp. TYQ1 TaxID=3119568 RepID=UPI001CCB6389|nr:glycerophosphodiester phosphodiesterase [Bremerella volcania]UBM38609.1 glycerophosphodiester phosphodiesterase [Bremerella volcania]
MRASAFFLVVTACWASFLGTGEAQMIVAHRGASFDAPENTLASFREAWAQKADAIEGDFYLTKDGHIVALHDKTTEKTTGGAAKLVPAKATLAELRNLDVGSWKHEKYAGEQIPLLEEVLATVPQSGKILVEIKCGVEIVEPLRVVLEKSSLRPEQIVIICFNEDVVKQCREKMPQYKANWLTSYKKNAVTGKWSPSVDSVLKTLKETKATGLGTKGEDAVVDAEFVRKLRDAGIECHVWTVNEPAQAKRYAELGFDSITTDKPAVIREALFGSPK